VRGYVRPDEWLDAMRKAFLRRVKDDAPTARESGTDLPPGPAAISEIAHMRP
jgi:hypothetical protein